MKRIPFNPDRVPKGHGYRYMYVNELVPDQFQFWNPRDNRWERIHIPYSVKVYLTPDCTSTRRVSRKLKPQF